MGFVMLSLECGHFVVAYKPDADEWYCDKCDANSRIRYGIEA